jgi:hypothetical protein
MIASGLLLRTFWDLFRVQPGFHPQSVMTVQTWLPLPNDPKTDIYGSVSQERTLIRRYFGKQKPCLEWRKQL